MKVIESYLRDIQWVIKNPELVKTIDILIRQYNEYYRDNTYEFMEYNKIVKKEWINYKDVVWWICSIPCIFIYLYKISIGYMIYKNRKNKIKKFLIYMYIKYDEVFYYIKNYNYKFY